MRIRLTVAVLIVAAASVALYLEAGRSGLAAQGIESTRRTRRDAGSSGPQPVTDGPTTQIGSRSSVEASADQDAAVDLANETSSQPAAPEPVSFDERYAQLSAHERSLAYRDLSERLSEKHSEVMAVEVEAGRGVIVDQEDFSFGAANDDDELDGGYFDGHTYYKVALTRFDEPELFLIRDELRAVVRAMNERSAEAGAGAR